MFHHFIKEFGIFFGTWAPPFRSWKLCNEENWHVEILNLEHLWFILNWHGFKGKRGCVFIFLPSDAVNTHRTCHSKCIEVAPFYLGLYYIWKTTCWDVIIICLLGPGQFMRLRLFFVCFCFYYLFLFCRLLLIVSIQFSGIDYCMAFTLFFSKIFRLSKQILYPLRTSTPFPLPTAPGNL